MGPCPPLLRLSSYGLCNVYVVEILRVNTYYLYNIEATFFI